MDLKKKLNDIFGQTFNIKLSKNNMNFNFIFKDFFEKNFKKISRK
jgi:hypothetical protein